MLYSPFRLGPAYMEKILTVNDVATVLQVKAITVREMFREKRIRGFKVGKSWRTTEVMLQEDINALARGESPAELPSAAAPPATPSPSPAPTPRPTPVLRAEAPKTEAIRTEGPTASAPRAPRKSPVASPGDAEDNTEDTQQLLF